MKELDELVRKIFDIPGRKKITLITDITDTAFVCIVNGDKFENEEIKNNFFKEIIHAFNYSGGLTIRANLDSIVNIIYGVLFTNRTWINLSAEEMKFCYNTDPETQEPLPEDVNVDFCDF